MTQAATFGRRGTAAPPQARASQPRPAARPLPQAARAAPQQSARTVPAPQAAPKADDDSLLGYFLWLLFSFDHRLDRRTYRYARIVANAGFLVVIYSLRSALEKSISSPGIAILLALLMLVLIGVMAWTTLAMQVKRRHDRDKSWAWLLAGFIPIAGPIWVLVETCWLDGSPGYNRFDDPAKAAAATFG
jgi:uncharacterized membrane protein YhaH (DUF805 family)